MTLESLRRIAAEAAVYLRALLRLARDPATPRAVRWTAIAVLAYALSPIDLIPDAIPLIGQLDDLIIVPLGVALVVWLTPAAHWRACLDAARAAPAEGLPRWRWGALLVVLAWVATVALLLAWAGAAWAAPGGAPAAESSVGAMGRNLRAPFTATVTKVSDGDTVWVKPAGGGRPLRLRLQGIDAPEICQSGGAQARAALQARALRQTVDVVPQARDAYGRVIASVRVAGRDVAADLVSDGWAWSDARPGWRGRYDDLERQARAGRRGLHAQPDAVRPADFRRAHGPCVPAARGGGQRAVTS